MNKFEILCVTMNQKDFSKIEEMNIQSNVVFANQANDTRYDEKKFDNHLARMITTNTLGVGKNRNTALMYADADICLFADDDIQYVDNLEKIVLGEFKKFPNADIIIFNLDSNSNIRKQKKYTQSKKYHSWQPMPWGAVRIAFRLSSIKKSNIWFTTLFGGGCLYPSGEDSMFLTDAKRKKLKFYISDKTIGTINFDDSSWFSGYNENFYKGKGAFFKANHPYSYYLWIIYFSFRTRKNSEISRKKQIKHMLAGVDAYSKGEKI